jgi:DNA-binding response OmpR family regulator
MSGEALRGRKVLVVEDDALIAMLISDVLTERGAIVDGPVGTAKAALQAAGASTCDLALLDVHLGRGSSAEVAALLRARGVPVAFVTGYGRSGLPETFQDAPIVAKPFRDADLVRVV